jgi:microcystin-dependent protein
MGNTPAGILLASNVTSTGDVPTTPGAIGGETNHTLTAAEIAPHTHGITDPGHQHTTTNVVGTGGVSNIVTSGNNVINAGGSGVYSSSTNVTGITVTNVAGGSTPPAGTAHNNMPPFMLGTWFMKL